MADESQYDTPSTTTNKRKYDDQTTPSSTRTRPTGFSSPDSALPPPPPLPNHQSYNNVPPPIDQFQAAKQKVQEVAARLLAATDPKRPRVDNGSSGFDSGDNKGFSSAPSDGKFSFSPAPSAIPVSYGSYLGGSSKKIEIPNGRVGVIIGKGGETIKYLQVQSGAKIQVTRDMDADPNAPTRIVELMGSPDQIAKAEQLVNDVLAEADAGGSGTVSRRFSGTGQGGSEHFVMKIPNSKVGLVIGKGGETIKNMQARTGARIQVIPLHLPPGDPTQERSVHIDGTSEQIEAAKQLVHEVTSSENRTRNPSMAGGYPQQGYQGRPPTNWAATGAPPAQQPGYGYMQPGGYPGPTPQYNMSQPPYAGYPAQQTSGGYPSGWDQAGVSANQQTSQAYDYYSQPPSQQQPPPSGPAAPTDNASYNYNQPPASGYNQQGQGYTQDGYGGYSQSSYGQPPSYDHGYGSAHGYGNVANTTQEGHTSYGAQGDSAQVPPQPPAVSQQGYNSGQQPSSNTTLYPPQGTTQPYGVPPTSQAGYGSQPPAQPGYGSSYGLPQVQKTSATPPVYGQAQQSPSTHGGYAQAGYPPPQPPPDSGSQRTPTSYGAAAGQAGYGPPYGAPPSGGQPGYGQGPPPPYSSYGAGYPQAAAYGTDNNATNNGRSTYEAAPASQPTAQQSGAAKASPPS